MEFVLGIILLIMTIGAFAVAIVRPWVCFAMIIAYPVTEQAIQSYFPFFEANRSAFNYLVAAAAASSVALRLFREPIARKCIFHPVLILVILLQVISYSSLLWTPDFENGLDLTVRRLPYSILYLVVAPLLITSIDDFHRVRMPMIIIATGALLLFLLGPTAQFRGVVLVIHYGGSAGTGNPGIVGEVGAIVLVFAVLSTYHGLGKWALPLQLGAGLFGLGMGLLSGTRGQVLVGGLVSFLFFPLSRRVKGLGSFFGIGIGMLVVVAILYAAVQFFVTDQNMDRWSADSLTGGVTGRFEIAQEAIASWLNDPVTWIFGRGAGAFITLQTAHAYPHNFAVETLTELGIVGFTLYLMVIAYVIRAGMGLYGLVKDDLDQRSATSVLCALAVFASVLSLKQGTIHSPGPFYVWLLVLSRIYKYESTYGLALTNEDDESDMDDLDDEFDDELEMIDEEEETDLESGHSHA